MQQWPRAAGIWRPAIAHRFPRGRGICAIGRQCDTSCSGAGTHLCALLQWQREMLGLVCAATIRSENRVATIHSTIPSTYRPHMVVCRNSFGQLGYGNNTSVVSPAAVGFVPLDGAVRQLVAGHLHTCAIYVNSSVKCWGRYI